jgi:hypothetical protein
MSPSEFFKLLEKHDWYYQYSDDHRAWEKGSNESKRIQAIAQEIPLFLDMYRDYSKFMFLPLDEREQVTRPELKDYLS